MFKHTLAETNMLVPSLQHRGLHVFEQGKTRHCCALCAQQHRVICCVCILLTWLRGLARTQEVQPGQVMAMLNELFTIFDQLVLVHGVHKVGDWIACGCALCASL